MKRIFLLVPLLLAVLACDFNVTTVPPTMPTQTIVSDLNTVSSDARVIPTTTQTAASDTAEETKIRDLVKKFGKRLQNVSLLAPDAVQEIQKEYSEYVSPTLLALWMNDVATAPGRMVSSPWPDRIEITTLTKESPDQYVITGFVIEVTSVEAVNGGAAARLPVKIVVHAEQGNWFITEYTQAQ